MGKQFKASTKLTAKFLVVLMVLQAVFVAFTASADSKPTSVTIHKTTAAGSDVSGTTIVAFKGTAFSLAVVPNAAVTSAAYLKNYWHSTDTTVIANVSATTAVKSFTPLKAGTVTLTVYNTTDNGSVSNTVSVNVYTKLTGFTLTPLTVKVNETKAIAVTNLLPSAITSTDVVSTTYSISSADQAFATVNSTTGVVTGVAAGKATVTVVKTLPDNSTVTKTVVVTVPKPVTSVTVKKGTSSVSAIGIDAGKTITLTAGVLPTEATDKKVNYSLQTPGDSAYVTLNTTTGAVYGKPAGIGHAVVVLYTANDTVNSAVKSVTFTVYKEFKSATLAKSTAVLKIGGTKQIVYPTITPSDASVTSVTYSSDATGVATVNSSGLITGVAAGTANISVIINIHDGVTKTLKIAVKVSKAVTGITILPATKSIKLYESYSIASSIAPSDASYKKVTYTSSDPSVAFVNPRTGAVTGIGIGTSTITGTTADGSFTDTSVVTVTDNFED